MPRIGPVRWAYYNPTRERRRWRRQMRWAWWDVVSRVRAIRGPAAKVYLITATFPCSCRVAHSLVRLRVSHPRLAGEMVEDLARFIEEVPPPSTQDHKLSTGWAKVIECDGAEKAKQYEKDVNFSNEREGWSPAGGFEEMMANVGGILIKKTVETVPRGPRIISNGSTGYKN